MSRFLVASALALTVAGASLAQAQAQVSVPADAAPAGTIPPTVPTVVDNTLPPPPASAQGKTYPVCTRELQDNCQNPGEGGAPGRSRTTGMKRHHRG